MTMIVPNIGDDAAAAGTALSREVSPAEKPIPQVPAEDGARKVRVLLADDHEIVRHGLAELLTQFAPAIEVVAEVGDGRSAVEMARLVEPDVIVMDVSMPELNGIEATRCILAEHPKIKVIGLSMYGEDDRAAAMRAAGAVAYLHKAGATEDLIATIVGCTRASD